MDSSSQNTALQTRGSDLQIALKSAISLWASATTSESERRADLLRDKQRIVLSFFRHTGKLPSEVEPSDVQQWLRDLEEKGISPGTTYQHACLLSSFYSWAIRDPEIGQHLRGNPARLARPKAPKPYQTESVKAMSDEEVQALVATVRRRALKDDLVGKRDYALLLMYLATGLRRSEIISLRGKDVHVDKTLILAYRAKGGDYRSREVREPQVKEALLDYLSAVGRTHALKTDAPLWTRHDRAGKPGEALTSHCFVKNLKKYAKEAGVKDFHLHRTRHTFARIVSEFTGDITATQNALDHQNRSTTRVYVQRIAVKRDLYSNEISKRWGTES
ncbi:MAG: integrase/recombinase XerD [Acidobacteriota bacterium]|jgi:site-specific recombinase XerD|nr:integrase/recombinase XerD [Acidobacteriota bacterium]